MYRLAIVAIPPVHLMYDALFEVRLDTDRTPQDPWEIGPTVGWFDAHAREPQGGNRKLRGACMDRLNPPRALHEPHNGGRVTPRNRS